MPPEDKWKANMEKVAFMKQFPGLVMDWSATVGKSIQSVTPLKDKAGKVVIVFQDGAFAVSSAIAPDPSDLKEALNEARGHLEKVHQSAYAEYDRLTAKDLELQRAARLENILGAIHNNLPNIPELKDRLKELVKQWK